MHNYWADGDISFYVNDGAIMSQDSQNAAIIKKPKLLNEACDRKVIRNAIRTKHYSMKTEEAYIHWIKKYIFLHNNRHPKGMGENEINQFLTRLAVNEKVSAALQN